MMLVLGKRIAFAATAGLATLALGASAFAGVSWGVMDWDGPTLVAMDEKNYEGDNELSLHCKGRGEALLGIGAEQRVGRGKGESVSVTLVSKHHRLVVKGRSRESRNVEMTGGTELRKLVTRHDPIFAVLKDQGPITVTWKGNRLVWTSKDRRDSVVDFERQCFR